MDNLFDIDFHPIQPGEVAASQDEIEHLLEQLPGWNLDESDDLPRLQRDYEFPDFSSALAFAHQLGVLADELDHHPSILIEWGHATVTWWTHELGGLHRNDFVSAAKTDRLYLVTR